MNPSRTALLIRCSKEEAGMVRAQAAAERRSISACIVNILERRMRIDEQYSRGITQSFLENQAREFRLTHRIYNRTTMLLRCSVEEAQRIRIAASNRHMSISEFVAFSLWRHWEAVKKIRPGALPEPSPAS